MFVIGPGKLDEVDGMRVFGFVPYQELPKILSNCSVYIHPARFDTFPIAVIEAMAAGLIPVVTEMTGTKDLVRLVSPSLVIPIDIDAISTKIIEILSMDNDKKEILSKKAKQVAEEWSLKARKMFLRKTMKALHEVIKEENEKL
jgi:glycosyltransferase involved in cell wall biosynthesis